FSVLALHDRRLGLHCVFVDAGGVALALLEQFVPGEDLARIAGFAAEDGGEGALGSVLGLVVDLAAGEGFDQIVLFLLVAAQFLAPVPPAVAFGRDAAAGIGGSFGPVQGFAHAAEGVGQ